MINHSQYTSEESGTTYRVFRYTYSKKNDIEHELKFINKHPNSKVVIDDYASYIEDFEKYHVYWNPGFPLNYTRWFKDGILIDKHLQTIEEYRNKQNNFIVCQNS